MAQSIAPNVSYSVVYRVVKSLLRQKIWGFQKRNLLKPIRNDTNFVFVYYPNSIAEAQLYPFYANKGLLAADFGIVFSAISLDSFTYLEQPIYPEVKTVCFQSHFNLGSEALEKYLSKLREKFPKAKLIYFDWFAQNDLRLLANVDELASKYIKKTIFKDEDNYYKTTFGDTNLMDYYGKLYRCSHISKRYRLPANINKSLMVGAGFLTSPYLSSLFSINTTNNSSRPIDLNARFSTNGHDWYKFMRSAAMEEAEAISESFNVVIDSVPLSRYLIEIGRSKITFSPFGYGEICWRDYEAFALGSLLIKPDMSHLKCNPDMFIPYETYIPISWDFSDFNEKFMYYFNSESERTRITNNAFDIGHDFHANHRFLDHVRELL